MRKAAKTWARRRLARAHFASYVYGCIRVFAERNEVVPLDIHIDSAVPIGVGLSSSAALEVATLRALRELFSASIDDVTLARLAQRAEIDYAGVNCGIMDQMAASLADTNQILFLDTRDVIAKLIPFPPGVETLVVNSGVARSLAASKYNERRHECEMAARELGLSSLRDAVSGPAMDALPETLRRRARHVVTENQRVLRAAEGVAPEEFGELMNASHESLRNDYEVSIAELDLLVGLLRQRRDVFGARMTGAGFGGACVALCRAGTAREVGTRVLDLYNGGNRSGALLVPEA